MLILIDNGHGAETKGKCSPDRSHFEYKWTRDFAKRLSELLRAHGIDSRLLVPEEYDVSLPTRAIRANNFAKSYGVRNLLLISIHNDAAPPNDGKWHNARGLTCFVHIHASRAAQAFAEKLQAAARANGFKGNRAADFEGFRRANFAILRLTAMPAVLVENLFQDNRDDVQMLHDEAALARLADVYCKTIEDYIAKKSYLL